MKRIIAPILAFSLVPNTGSATSHTDSLEAMLSPPTALDPLGEMTLPPSMVDFLIDQGDIAFRTGNDSLALGYFSEALESSKDSEDPIKKAYINSSLASLYYKKGDFEKVLFHNEKAFSLDPTDLVYQNNLAFAYALNNTSLDRALELATDAANQRPDNHHSFGTLGFVHLKRGEYGPAIESFESAITILDRNPNPPSDDLGFNHYFMGEALRRSGAEGSEEYRTKAFELGFDASRFIPKEGTVLLDSIIEEAKIFLGWGYQGNGRDAGQNPGIDCMGLAMLPYARTFGESWEDYSYVPSELIESGKLGTKVELIGNQIDAENISRLQRGDVIYLLVGNNPTTDPETRDRSESIEIINGQEYWSLHMAIYSGDGKIIHAAPWKPKVIEEPLFTYANPIIATRRVNGD